MRASALALGGEDVESTSHVPPKTLIESLHRVGARYWYRPDTADCLIKVVRLSSCQHARHRCDRQIHDQIPHSHSEERASDTRGSFGKDKPTFPNLPPTVASAPQAHSTQTLPTSSDTEPSKWALCLRDQQATSCIGQTKVCDGPGRESRQRCCIDSQSRPVTHTLRRRISGINHTSIVGGNSRRDSAPPGMCGPAAVTSVAGRQCPHCPRHGAEEDHEARTYSLHSEFLTSQSDLFRDLLGRTSDGSRASPPDMGRACVPSVKKRIFEVALPDPSSFTTLVEYFYLGNFGTLASAMESGQIRWETVMLNARHLGLSQELKMQLGAWWKIHQDRPIHGRRESVPLLHRQGLLDRHTIQPHSARDFPSFRLGRPRSNTIGVRPQICSPQAGSDAHPLGNGMRTFVRTTSGLSTSSTIDGISESKRRCREVDSGDADDRKARLSPQDGSDRKRFGYDGAGQPGRSELSGLECGSSMDRLASPCLSREVHFDVTANSRADGRGAQSKEDQQAVKISAAAGKTLALRQLLTSGKRRRALSSVAHYHSTGLHAPPLAQKSLEDDVQTVPAL